MLHHLKTPNGLRAAAIVVTFAALCFTGAAHAATYEVASTTAFTNALDLAVSGDEIVFTNGCAISAGTYAVTNGITIRGSSADRSKTVLSFGYNKVLVQLNHESALLKDVTIDGGSPNTTKLGVVQILAGGGTVSNCLFRNGHGSKGPSAIAMTGGRVTGCTIHNTGTRDEYGAVYVNGENALFDHCFVTNCSYGSGGSATMKGTVYLAKGTVSDCVIAKNKLYSQYTAGVYIDGDSTLLRNCTVVSNTATSSGSGGIYWPMKTGARVVNCIVAGNVSTTGSDPEIKKSGTAQDASLPNVFLNNCVRGLDIGTSCQTVASLDDVKFKDAAASDYSLMSDSPAVNKGTDSHGLSATDVVGKSRSMGSSVDIGALEYDEENLTCDFKVVVGEGLSGSTYSLTSTVQGESGTVGYSWTFVNGETVVESSEANPSVTLTVPGYYDASLEVTSGGSTASYSLEKCLFVGAPEIYVLWNAASPVYPYDSIETATTNLVDAVAAASNGSVIHVSGTNVVTETVALDKAITVEGMHGRDADRVRQMDTVWHEINYVKYRTSSMRVFSLNHAGAVIRGMTITGGGGNEQYYKGSGVYVTASGGLIEDCAIVSNINGNHYSYGCGLYVASGSTCVVRRCIFRNNFGGVGTQGAGIFLAGGVLESCLVEGNHCDTGSGSGIEIASPSVVVRNCTVVKNYGATGGIYFTKASLASGCPEIVNCVFDGNYTNAVENVCNWFAESGYNAENLAASFAGCAFTTGTLPSATGSILVAEPGFAEDGSYQLVRESALCNKGVWQSWMPGATDLYGNPRVNVAKKVDIGCSEMPWKPLFIIFIR